MMPAAGSRILLVDDDHTFRVSTAELLRQDGHEVIVAASGQEAVNVLRAGSVDIMLLDFRMPGLDGVGVAEALRCHGEGIPILMISGVGTVDDAVHALHVGVDDFLTKPVEPDLLCARVSALLERRPRVRESESAPGRLVGRAPSMRAVFDAIDIVSKTEATVLLSGETGTGKELAARAIHERSPRHASPFVAVDCAALAEGVIESELFGHVRGAFTGALRDRQGLFQAANGGTIFLDEIGDISGGSQQRLLRVLQEREVLPVGAVRPVLLDVRVIAATNRDLSTLIAAGRFREDLYYRLNVFRIDIPPLRDRARDVPLLVETALARRTPAASGRALPSCSPLAMRMLQTYRWPGNVRQLFAVVESAVIRAGHGRIDAQHLPPEVRAALNSGDEGAGGRYRVVEADDERSAILSALQEAEGVRARAADLLGMSRTTLWRKMKEYGFDAVMHS